MTHALVTAGALAALPFLLNIICREVREAFRAAFGD